MGRINKNVRKKRKKDLNILKKIAGHNKDFMLVEDMEEVEYFPTLLTGYNRATGIGGHPRKRITVIHGPPQVGKSALAMALAESARRCLHASVLDDTERASEKRWYISISPKSGLFHSKSLDTMRERFHEMMNNLINAKKAKDKKQRIPKDAGCFYILDTITMLYPDSMLDDLSKKGIDRMYPLQAMWVSVWMNEVVHLLHESNSSLVLVLQERKNMDPNSRRKWRLPGGESVQYDNCMRARVTHCQKVLKNKKVVGLQSFYEIQNNKIDGTSMEKASFFTSNGKGDVPKGLDLVLEAIEEGKIRGVLKQNRDEIKIGLGDYENVIEGGMVDVRKYFYNNKQSFRKYVNALNEHVRR